MLKFVVLSSNKEHIRGCEETIGKLLMGQKIQYKCYKFNDNDKKLHDFIEKNHEQYIYILEETNDICSIEIMKEIRNKYKDLTSFIIIIDFNNAIKRQYIENNFCIHTEIVSNEEELLNKITQIIRVLNINNQKLTFNYNSYLYNIDFSSILYIEKQIDSKKCMIVCKNDIYYVNKSLKKIKEMLNEYFVQTHQSAIVNINNIISIDFVNSVIFLTNNKQLNLFSRSNKKILKCIMTKKVEKITK